MRGHVGQKATGGHTEINVILSQEHAGGRPRAPRGNVQEDKMSRKQTEKHKKKADVLLRRAPVPGFSIIILYQHITVYDNITKGMSAFRRKQIQNKDKWRTAGTIQCVRCINGVSST